jgi:lipase maturation factor 1
MVEKIVAALQWMLDPRPARKDDGEGGYFWARWIFLRVLGAIYFSAFFSLIFEIRGMLGPNGILPVADYLQAVGVEMHATRFLFAPTALWLGASDGALMILCWVGIAASLLVVVNLWPRASLLVCFVSFLSFVCVAQEFSGFQSDGMLLEAGFIAIFFAPAGLRPRLGKSHPPSRASLYLLRWEWFRIYFESGVAKIRSGDVSWRNLTAMDDYYQNGPLPTWIGWYVQHLPHWFHASAAFFTLLTELALVWMVFLPRRFRILLFCIVTPFEISIILTANYTFLNYLVLLLGVLLLDDRTFQWIFPARFQTWIANGATAAPETASPSWRQRLTPMRRLIAGACLGLVFYSTTAQLLWMFAPGLPLPESPVRALEPFRIANRYGLFAVMTHERYEIEFQGTSDGTTWVTYPFRFKPQDLRAAPGIYAPYQPRFEWCLWFASLGGWRENRFVVWTEERLLKNDPDVLSLFAQNPFASVPPRRVRAVIYQYWFTDMKTKRETGNWWRRELIGEYAPALELQPDGKIMMIEPAGSSVE